MKITLKDFLAEQAKLGIKVPQIFENLDSFSGAPVTPSSDDDGADGNLQFAYETIVKAIYDQLEGLTVTERELLTEKLTQFLTDISSTSEKTPQEVQEGFFGNIKNALTGTLEYQTTNNYAGSPEAQAFVAKDKRAAIQIETLTKKGMAPEEAKSAVMFVYDKNSKNPLGFVGKAVTFDPATKTLKVGNSPGLGTKNL